MLYKYLHHFGGIGPLVEPVVQPLPIHVRLKPGRSPVTRRPIPEADGNTTLPYVALQPLVYLDAVDLEHSTCSEVSNSIPSFQQVALFADKVSGHHLFRTTYPAAGTFVSEEFALLVTKHKLHGLKRELTILVS